MIEATDLIGTWQFTRDGEKAFIHFTYTQAFDYLADGEAHQMLRLWYEMEDEGVIRFRTHPKDEGWTCCLRIAGETLFITADHLVTTCTRARTEEIPQWFVAELTASNR